MAPLFQVECPKCNSKNKSGARFCGSCGDRLPGSELKCGNCGAMVAANKSFCGNCGKPLSESAAPQMTGNRWARRVDDFATKVEVDDVEGFFKRGLIVEAGTKSIFFTNGAYSGILEPGRYDMGGLLQRIKNIFNYKTTTAVLVDAGDVELQFSLDGLMTRDPIRLTAECRLVVQMENPTQFFENMMKGRQNYSLTEMKAFLEGEVRNCFLEFVGGKTVQEISTNQAFKAEMEQGVAQHLAKTFDRKGLAFVQVRIFDFRHPRMDAVNNKKEEYWLHAQDLETKLAGEGSTLGLERKLLDQETAKTLMQLEVYEDRAQVFERMRKAVSSEEMNKVTSENELEKFLQGIDKDKLLRAEEMSALVRDFGEKKEDHQMARAHLTQRLGIEQNIDLARAQLMGQISLKQSVSDAVRANEMGQLDHELAADRRKMEAQQASEWQSLKQKVASQTVVAESTMDLAKKQALVEDEITRRQQATTVDMEGLKHAQDMRETIDALDILKKQKELKKMTEDWELDRKLREAGGMSELTMKQEKERHERELENIKAYASLSTEALIAAAPSDRAAMLADLKRTEGLKGFSEEQILAMAADKSPEIAKAFQEKFRSVGSGDLQKAYQKMLDMKDQGTNDIKEMSREHARMVQEMFNRALDTQRDTATAAARSATPGTTVITPGSGILQTGAGGVMGRMVVCPACHRETQEGHKFCDNCGHKFYE